MLFHPETEKLLRICTALELEQVTQEHGKEFHSDHEAYAVILEEMRTMRHRMEELQSHFDILLTAICAGATGESLHNTYDSISLYATWAAMSLCQVSACCEKAQGK